MKRIFFSVILLISTVALNAKGKQCDLTFLNHQSKLHVVADFSNTQILGAGDTQLAEWNAMLGEDSTLYVKRFYNGVVEGLGNRFLLVGNQPNAEYKVLMIIEQVDSKGNVFATFRFSPMNDDIELCTLQMKGEGGRIGTFLSLFCDGMRSLGEEFGELIKKNTKK